MTKYKFTSNDGIHINVIELKYMKLNINKKYSRIIFYSLFASKQDCDSTKICNPYSNILLITLSHIKSIKPTIF